MRAAYRGGEGPDRHPAPGLQVKLFSSNPKYRDNIGRPYEGNGLGDLC